MGQTDIFINTSVLIIYMIHKTITIREDQAHWVAKRHEFILSQFVRQKLDELIALEKEAKFKKASDLAKEAK